jgi:hypothetical protein
MRKILFECEECIGCVCSAKIVSKGNLDDYLAPLGLYFDSGTLTRVACSILDSPYYTTP